MSMGASADRVRTRDQALVQGLKSLVSLGGSRQQSQWTTVEQLKVHILKH